MSQLRSYPDEHHKNEIHSSNICPRFDHHADTFSSFSQDSTLLISFMEWSIILKRCEAEI